LSIWRLAPASQLGLALAGVALTAAVLSASAFSSLLPLGDMVRLPQPSRVLLIASAGAVLLTAGLVPRQGGVEDAGTPGLRPRGGTPPAGMVARWDLLAAGLGALGVMAVLVAVTDPLAVALLLILAGFGSAVGPGRRPMAVRARGPALAGLLLGVGWALHPSSGALGRLAALSLALSLVAVAALVPYLPEVDTDEPASSSYLTWTGFLAPALAVTLPIRVVPALTAEQATVFGASLVGLGLLNLGWGVVGAWRTGSDIAAWRYSFLADWGLVLIGVGFFQREGFAASYLALLSIVLVRLPLYMLARPDLPAGPGTVSVLVAVVLAGVAPFAGFPVRLLLLQAATRVAWPLAVLLLAAMVLWIAHSLRLARTLSAPVGRAVLGLWLTIAISLGLGLFSGALRAAAGL